jgi:hypothetical protein
MIVGDNIALTGQLGNVALQIAFALAGRLARLQLFALQHRIDLRELSNSGRSLRIAADELTGYYVFGSAVRNPGAYKAALSALWRR